ncbi:hypothetical protein JG687_00019534 [Phytophthora cactorum]|uniref:Uncharacterized protein n=1 Tax=Phytophthora cactorum TaxID=29920 RepID=A0A8T1TLN8_9STRA|nr:hypothetical protein JG687_00019534 [Phytophthora cactorum]
MDYPVECGMQCIQQNNDCGRENAAKISAVAMGALSMASFGVFGQLAKYGKKVSWAVTCANYLMVFVRAVIRFTRNQMTNEPETSQAKLLLLLYQTNYVVADLPATIIACSGRSTPASLQLTRQIMPTAQFVLLLVLSYDDQILESWEKFKAFMKRANFTEAADQITQGEISSLETVMINDLIDSGKSDNGTSMAAKHNAYTWLRNALFFASFGWDPTDLSTIFSEFLQTICGPTQFMGEVDDGNEAATLGMSALHKAFKNSTLSWTKKGDGGVIINFKSKDTKDVTINIMSGGDKIDEVDLKAGGTAQWRANITALGGKTLYLDRWRPGLFGLPGTGGGSLVLWVPISRQGGHLELTAQLNVS